MMPFDRRCQSGGKNQAQRGAALLAAMLTVTLVATFAATALWQQFRSIEVETAERSRVQSGWVLTGALDWSRLILREDARSGGADHLAEPWAVPLNEARLSSFLAVDKTATDTERDAFLSGQIIDLQGRLNVTNLIEGNAISDAELLSFRRLFDLLGLAPEQLSLLSSQLLLASRASQAAQTPQTPQTPPGMAQPVVVVDGSTPLMPQRVEQLLWFGLQAETLALLDPYITLLPARTPLNLNTASAEAIYASAQGIELADAQRLVTARERSHFRTLADAERTLGGLPGRFDGNRQGVASRFFEVRGLLRLESIVVQERSLVHRDGLVVRTLWRDRGVVPDLPAGTGPRP